MSRPIVIKYGGSLLEDEKNRAQFLKDVAVLSKKEKVLLVHGGGKEISRAVEQSGLPVRFVQGRRYTDDATMAIVDSVLAGINRQIVEILRQAGVAAESFSGLYQNLMTAAPIADLGRVGQPEKVDEAVLAIAMRAKLPVFYSVAGDAQGKPLNINADDFALALAVACKASRLVYLTDSGAILDSAKKPLERLLPKDVERLISDGTITGGMRVKAQACVQALGKGVGEVDICKGIEPLLNTKAKMEGTRFIQHG